MTTATTIRRTAEEAVPPATPARPSVVILATSETLRRSVSRILARVPFDVHATRSPEECHAVVAGIRPDLVIVECRGWPELPHFLAKLHDTARAPVVLTGPDEAQGLEALSAGLSVDYVRSPVWEHELRARAVRSLASDAPMGVRRFDDLEIDSAARSVRRAGGAVELSPREFDLLDFLAAHAGRSFSRQDLLENVWKSSADWQQPATVTEHIFRLRRKLEADPTRPRWIVTVPRFGYRFEANGAAAARGARRETVG